MKLKISAVRDILRYRQLGLSYSEIANTIGCSKSSVKKYIDRAVGNNAEHSVAAALSDSSLGDILQPRQRNLHGQIDPDWQAVFLEHTQKDFSLKELWQNYVELVGEEHALKYSAFCENYRKFVKTLPEDLVEGYLALDGHPESTSKLTTRVTASKWWTPTAWFRRLRSSLPYCRIPAHCCPN